MFLRQPPDRGTSDHQTSDTPTSTAASPAVSDTSTLPWTEYKSLAVATLACTGGDSGGISNSTLPLGPPPILTPDVDQVSDNVPASDLSDPILLPSNRIEASSLVDRATMDAAIESIFFCLYLQQTVVDRYQSMESALA
uniref:Uncharacterized protein n=1 Tax=Peronospora matthiolae TaxID=2874970 RepID=A0AAV1UBW6_9STRA